MGSGWIGFLYRITEWITRLAYVNLLWILFTLMGLVVFGAFPATVSLCTVERQWIKKDTNVSVWMTFWNTYRNEFLKANAVGYIFLIIGLVIYIDMRVFQGSSNILFSYVSYIFLIILIFYMFVGMFLFPVYVHFELKVLQYFKQTFLVAILNPFAIVSIAVSILITYFIMFYMPPLLIFFGISVLAFITMWLTLRSIDKLQVKFNNRYKEG
ncbi:YesL family protein [Oceanobacillus neutriphilus]|uniref:DUF624 domain-containing protein n=1 Tax=Oceanobacillus neutriphilus TaxID=531815 RepID=A0ABQ2NY15_9BACI|nr:YesL family protein [Oceanobacillus neutriphilus]GGP13261.1 hypothetical protein GCM10011346_32630 [Oceanobacillus neutriphilus]